MKQSAFLNDNECNGMKYNSDYMNVITAETLTTYFGLELTRIKIKWQNGHRIHTVQNITD